jgi:phytoene/squalene synthetase
LPQHAIEGIQIARFAVVVAGQNVQRQTQPLHGIPHQCELPGCPIIGVVARQQSKIQAARRQVVRQGNDPPQVMMV